MDNWHCKLFLFLWKSWRSIKNFILGENLEILLDTLTLQIPSGSPLKVNQLIAPAPVASLEPVLDAENVTLQWKVPRGRVDIYTISWYPVNSPQEQRAKTVTGDIGRDSPDNVARILIESLQPGVNYHFEMTTRSHALSAPTLTKIIRTQPLCTSDVTFITNEDVTTALTLRYTMTPRSRSNFDTYRFDTKSNLITCWNAKS